MLNDEIPLVSILVPVYNSHAYLKECLDSILAQTYPAIEILIGDDASSNPLNAEIINSYQAQFPDKIRSFSHDKNLGVVGNVNFLTAQSKGQLITNFAGDDVMVPDKIAKSVKFLLDHPEYALCHHDSVVFQSESRQKLYNYSDRFPLCAGNVQDFIAGRFYVATNTVLFWRRYLPDPVQDSTLGNVSDFDFLVRTMECASELSINPLGYIPETLIFYRRHKDNLSAAKNNKIYNEQILMFEKCIARNVKNKHAAQIGMSERSFQLLCTGFAQSIAFFKAGMADAVQPHGAATTRHLVWHCQFNAVYLDQQILDLVL